MQDTGSDDDRGDLEYSIKGLWVETILYEIPLLALTSQAYFMFVDKDWDYHSQVAKSYRKGCELLENGCVFSEFGSRRRRDYHTQDLVMQGLCRAAKETGSNGWKGKFSGTSNVHFAMKYDVNPVGTVAHEWFMAIAAITQDYEDANELALRYWLCCFGEGVRSRMKMTCSKSVYSDIYTNWPKVLGIALTDTFGTPAFLDSFRKPIPSHTIAGMGSVTVAPSGRATTESSTQSESEIEPPISAPLRNGNAKHPSKTYAQVYTGVRQDSGDPQYFIKMVRDFYNKEGITDQKTIVFSDSLDIEHCLDYKVLAEEAGFTPVFGVGTFLTSMSNIRTCLFLDNEP